MAIRIFQPVYLHKVGKRNNNEDSIAPFDGTATLKDRLFIVCDGVGGANKGEIASRIVADQLQQYFADNPAQQVGQNYLNRALQFVEAILQNYVDKHKECAGMATTLTLLYLNDQQNTATVAWVGDSRIYQVREGEVLFETQDHSLVNELVRRGEITEEEAKVHPQRNVILRAITGSNNPVQIDVRRIEDLQAGDYFLLCTDGVLESVDNRILVTLLQNSYANLVHVRDQINSLCAQYSKDNYSMYLLQLSDLLPNTADLGIESSSTQVLDGLPASGDTAPLPTGNHTSVLSPPPKATKPTKKKDRTWLYGLAAIALLSLLGLGFWTMYQNNQEEVYQKYVEAGDKALENKDFVNAIAIYEKAKADFPKNTSEIELKIGLVNDQQQAEIQRLALRDSLSKESQFLYDQFLQIDSTQQENLNNVFGRTDELTLEELQQFVQDWQDSLKVIQPSIDEPDTSIETPDPTKVDTSSTDDGINNDDFVPKTDTLPTPTMEESPAEPAAENNTIEPISEDTSTTTAPEGNPTINVGDGATEPDTSLSNEGLETVQQKNMDELKKRHNNSETNAKAPAQKRKEERIKNKAKLNHLKKRNNQGKENREQPSRQDTTKDGI